MKKKINNISLEDAKAISKWLLSSAQLKKMEDSQIKAIAREHLRLVKQTPEECIAGINKDLANMPKHKSF